MVQLEASRTAVIVVDLWDSVYCKTLQKWLDRMVLRLNIALVHFRKLGIPILFMGENVIGPYRDTVGHKLLGAYGNLRESWGQINHPIAPGRDTWWLGKCLCDTDVMCKDRPPPTRIHRYAYVHEWDLIGGWNQHTGFIRGHGIQNLLYCGIAANICVLDTRHFSICNSIHAGMNCFFMSDLTETVIPGVPRERALEDTMLYYNRFICTALPWEDIKITGTGIWSLYL